MSTLTTNWMIRPMVDDDYADAFRFWASMVGLCLTKAEYRAGLALLMRHAADRHYMAVCEGEIVGTLLGVTDGAEARVEQMVIAPEFQEQGIEHALYEAYQANRF